MREEGEARCAQAEERPLRGQRRTRTRECRGSMGRQQEGDRRRLLREIDCLCCPGSSISTEQCVQLKAASRQVCVRLWWRVCEKAGNKV